MPSSVLGVWLLAQIVLGRAETPPMPGPAAIGTWGIRAFSARQETEVLDHYADYEDLVLAALAPGHGLHEDVFAMVRDHAASRAPLAAQLRGWAEGPVIAPAPRDGIRTWGPAAVVDSLVAEDRAKAAAWLAELGVEPGVVPAEAAPEPLTEPAFAPEPCAAPADPPSGRGTIAGVARSVDGVLVERAGVYLPGPETVVMTDAAGRFELCGVPAGSAELRVSHATHRDVAGTVAVLPGQVTRVEILLYAPQD